MKLTLPSFLRTNSPLDEARRQLAHAQLARLEAASMRESWSGFEDTLKRRIKRLEDEVAAFERAADRGELK